MKTDNPIRSFDRPARFGALGLLWMLGSAAFADTVIVGTTSELESAVRGANSQGGDRTILVEDGVYELSSGLWVDAPRVSIIGQSGNRDEVVIRGDAMSPSASVGNVITVNADDFTLEHVTLQFSRYHLIQIKGENDVDGTVLRNCVLKDAYEQIVKVSIDENNLNVSGDDGLIENCVFEYSAGVGPQYYIGGLDAHGSDNWIVRNNEFRNIISPGGSIAQYAIHFWNGSSDNLVENNVIVDCDRGIGFGLSDRGNEGGTIINNMIYHAANKGQFADVGIALQNSPGSRVANNSIYFEHSYPAAIEYRFSGTRNVAITNNLTNRSVSRLDGAAGDVTNNMDSAQASWFVSPRSGDLHLASSTLPAVDSGIALAYVTEDFDGEARPSGSAQDVGADEYSASVRPNPPTGLTAN